MLSDDNRFVLARVKSKQELEPGKTRIKLRLALRKTLGCFDSRSIR